MANTDHVALARSGANAIARWRELTFRSPNTRLPRYSLNYQLADRAASETFQPEFIYGRAALDLSGAFLSGAKLAGADLSHDDLSRADLTQSDLRMADLSGANLQSSHLSRSNLSHANINGAHLSGASLGRANLGSSSLQSADLRGADLSHSDFGYANLENANLSGADLSGADFSWANLSHADLRGAKLTATSLKMADLTGADLRGAKFTKADLESAVVSGAVFGITVLANCDLSTVIGLGSVRHAGPSVIGLDTIARSRGMLPKSFLEGAGVAEPLLAAQEAMLESNRAYPSVLFVGSKADEALCLRLREGLARSQIRSWIIAADDEDALQAGSVELSDVVYYDRVLLLCTSQALESPQTSRYFAELARASGPNAGGSLISLGADGLFYQREDRLCSTLKKGRVVDFSGWEDEQTYQASLLALVQVLTGKPA